MYQDPKILTVIIIITVTIVAAIFYFDYRLKKREAALAKRLWETGATRLLSQVWGLSNEYPHGEIPLIGEPAHVTRRKILNHIWGATRNDQVFEQIVCGENVKVTLYYPNTLFGFVDEKETCDAIQQAHDLMSDRDQQLYIGTIPLILDIRVTDPMA